MGRGTCRGDVALTAGAHLYVSMSIVFAAFVLGFLGSAHCLGMCGPFVMGISRIGESRGRPIVSQLAYFAGKTSSYAVLGAVAGGLSGLLLAALDNFQRSFSIALGLLLVLTGIVLLARLHLFPGLEARLFGKLGDAMGVLVRRHGTPSLVTLGMLNGLLPCGLVYGAVILAATTGSIWMGALSMAAFGLATIPALALVAAGSQWLMRSRWRERFVQAGAVLILLMGLLTIARGADVMDRILPHSHGIEADAEAPSRHVH
jgi:uncharacterized protein